MVVSKEEFFEILTQLMKGEEGAQLIVDYMDKPIHQVSSVDLYLAINEVHGHKLAKTFTDYLEQQFSRKKSSNDP